MTPRAVLRRSGWLLVVMCLLPAWPAAAQPPGRPPQGRPQPQGEMPPGEVQRVFDDLVLRQARQRLDLAPEQVEPFTARLRGLQMVRRRALGERNRIFGELARLSNPQRGPADEGLLAARLDELSEFESRQAGELRQAYRALDEVLDVAQRARFRVLEEQLERRKLELITRARQGGGRPPGSRF
ncbi:MAG: hypothetical protein Q8L86_20250 [Vicinamibacterales bacterium]|nr:hypothetical protein [Vicinamibacterales bacterium]